MESTSLTAATAVLYAALVFQCRFFFVSSGWEAEPTGGSQAK
jgi:hypothetical protein